MALGFFRHDFSCRTILFAPIFLLQKEHARGSRFASYGAPYFVLHSALQKRLAPRITPGATDVIGVEHDARVQTTAPELRRRSSSASPW